MATARKTAPAVWVAVFLLIAVVVLFAVMRILVDANNLTSGRIPPEGDFDRRYALNPVLAYAHIIPGLVYLTLAPLQLSRRFRTRHLAFHRRLGRVLVPTGIVTGPFAVVFGLLFPFGGLAEASAALAFGAYFIASLLLAYRSIRAGDTISHRRWMIRAFAMGLAVGTIRIWIGLFEGLGLLGFDDSFGLAFWLAFSMHAVAAEIWLRRRPA